MDNIRFLQYIGARYVPKFYVNSQNPDSSEWEANVDYEYMTWVSLSNGTMYLSKENVPASIGSPANNPRYWMTAGQFNAYIQQLQSEINDMKDGTVPGSLQDQINDMNDSSVPGSLQDQINVNRSLINKKFIFFGDSYAVGFQPGGDEVTPDIEGFYKKAVSYLGLPATQYTLVEYGRAGFIASGTNSKTWRQDMFDLADDETVTDIYVMGGANDIQYSGYIAQLIGEINAFVTLAKTKFPNAKIHIGFCGRQSVSTYFDPVNMRKVIEAYKTGANQAGAEYLVNAENILKGVTSCMASDHYHPNVTGETLLAQHVVNHITGGSGRVHDDTYRQCSFIYDKELTSGLRIGYTQTEDSITITHVYNDILSGTLTAQQMTDFSTWELATLDGDEFAGDAYKTFGGECRLYVVADSMAQIVDGFIYFDNKTLKLKMYATNPNHTGAWVPTAITNVGLLPFTFTIPKITIS